jgi:hypothetical protein
MTMIVLDVSAALAWIFERADEASRPESSRKSLRPGNGLAQPSPAWPVSASRPAA